MDLNAKVKSVPFVYRILSKERSTVQPQKDSEPETWNGTWKCRSVHNPLHLRIHIQFCTGLLSFSALPSKAGLRVT